MQSFTKIDHMMQDQKLCLNKFQSFENIRHMFQDCSTITYTSITKITFNKYNEYMV